MKSIKNETKRNILAREGAPPRGAQQEDPQGVEEDGMNETILPVDWRSAGMITDDEMGEVLVRTLPDGVRLTAVMDSCHSGTGLDLPFSWQPRGGGAGAGGWREETNPYHSLGDVQMISGCEDGDVSCDAAGWGRRYGASGGAMTMALCEVLRVHPAPSYPVLLEEMRRLLHARGMAQRPQLSSSQILHVDRPFLVDDICSNSRASSSSKEARMPACPRTHPRTPVPSSAPGARCTKKGFIFFFFYLCAAPPASCSLSFPFSTLCPYDHFPPCFFPSPSSPPHPPPHPPVFPRSSFIQPNPSPSRPPLLSSAVRFFSVSLPASLWERVVTFHPERVYATLTTRR